MRQNIGILIVLCLMFFGTNTSYGKDKDSYIFVVYDESETPIKEMYRCKSFQYDGTTDTLLLYLVDGTKRIPNTNIRIRTEKLDIVAHKGAMAYRRFEDDSIRGLSPTFPESKLFWITPLTAVYMEYN